MLSHCTSQYGTSHISPSPTHLLTFPQPHPPPPLTTVITTMPLELRELQDDSEFTELTQCECESYNEPLNTFFRLFRHDQSPAGFIELRDRQIRNHRTDPTSRWFKVVDTDMGDKVIGSANWNTFTENPYKTATGERVKYPIKEANWWSEGE